MSPPYVPYQIELPLQTVSKIFNWTFITSFVIATSVFLSVELNSQNIWKERLKWENLRGELNRVNEAVIELRRLLRESYQKEHPAETEAELLKRLVGDIERARKDIEKATRETLKIKSRNSKDEEITVLADSALCELESNRKTFSGVPFVPGSPLTDEETCTINVRDAAEWARSEIGEEKFFTKRFLAGSDVSDILEFELPAYLYAAWANPKRFYDGENDNTKEPNAINGTYRIHFKGNDSREVDKAYIRAYRSALDGSKLQAQLDIDLEDKILAQGDGKYWWLSSRRLRALADSIQLEATPTGLRGTNKFSISLPQTSVNLPIQLAVSVLPLIILIATVMRIFAMRRVVEYLRKCPGSEEPVLERVFFLFNWLVDCRDSIRRQEGKLVWLVGFAILPTVAWLYAAATIGSIEELQFPFVGRILRTDHFLFAAAIAVAELLFVFFAYLPTIRLFFNKPTTEIESDFV